MTTSAYLNTALSVLYSLSESCSQELGLFLYEVVHAPAAAGGEGGRHNAAYCTPLSSAGVG